MLNWETNFKIAVKTSDGRVHTGKVNIQNFQRLSDFLKNKDDEFIVIVPDEENSGSEVLMLNKSYIIEAKEAARQETIGCGDASAASMSGHARN